MNRFDALDDEMMKVDEEETPRAMEGIESKPRVGLPDPVSLDDLMTKPNVKVISPRRTPRDNMREVGCHVFYKIRHVRMKNKQKI